MRIKLQNLLFYGILVQIFSTQGVLLYNLFNVIGNWELKSLIHPLGVLMISFYFFLKINHEGKIALSTLDLLLVGYLILNIVPLAFNVESFLSFYIGFREVFLIFFIIIIYKQGALSFEQWQKILKLLYILCIVNIVFVALTFILGPEDFMTLITGRYRWGADPELKFKISNIDIFWRSPAMIGDPAAVGIFGLITYFLFLNDSKYKKKFLLPIALVVLSFTRSNYLMLVIFMVLNFISQRKNLKILHIALPYLTFLFIVILIVLNRLELLSVKSLIMRLDLWVNKMDVDFSWIHGGSIGLVGGAVRGEGFVSIVDSYWLLNLISIGVAGIVIILLFFYNLSINNQRLKLVLIAFMVGAFLISLTQSMTFLTLFPLLFLTINEKKVISDNISK